MPKPSTMNRSVAARPLGRSRRDCPICSSRDLSYEFIVQGFPVCGCDHCGLLFLNPQPDRAVGETAKPGAPQMQESVYELHASNASSRLDQLMAYIGGRPEHVLMIANDPFLTDAARQRGLDVVSLTSADVEAGALAELAAGRLRCRGILLCARAPVGSGSGASCPPPHARPVGGRDGDCADDRQPHGAVVSLGLVGVHRREPALFLRRHAPEPADQDRLRRPDYRRRRQCGVARVLPVQDPGGVVRMVPRDPEAPRVGDAAVSSPPRLPFPQQQAGRARPHEEPERHAKAVGHRPGVQRAANARHTDGSRTGEIDRRRRHRSGRRREQFDRRHA